MDNTLAEKDAGMAIPRVQDEPGADFSSFFSKVKTKIGVDLVWVVTTAPRGRLQLVQPGNLYEHLLKAYDRSMHLDDALTWQAMIRRHSVRASELPAASKFNAEMESVAAMAHLAAAPLRAPVFPGFGGALHVGRTSSNEDFTQEQLATLLQLAREYDRLIDQQRAARRAKLPVRPHDPSHRSTQRLFAFRSDGRSILPDANIGIFDSHLQGEIRKHVRDKMANVSQGASETEQVLLADEYGDLWAFHSVSYSSYPALSSGPVLVLALEPAAPEWALIRPSDFPADEEAARLAPAIQFMIREACRMPSLDEVAHSVFLSPFHFHRRFSAVFGITPKHLLLAGQVHESKIYLMSREEELAKVAEQCGFAHQSHFTSRFKQATGLTPTRWRRMVGERLKGQMF